METNQQLFKDYDPSAMAIPGKPFGLPHNAEQAKMHVIQIESAITVSGSEGAELGPVGLLEGSAQIELYNRMYPRSAYIPGMYLLPSEPLIIENHTEGREAFRALLEIYDKGDSISDDENEIAILLKKIDDCSVVLNNWVIKMTQEALRDGKIPAFLGGCHGSMYGGIKASAEYHEEETLFQFDAHKDLRKAFEGAQFSHASIMYNILENVPQIKKLISVGIRSYGLDETDYVDSHPDRIKIFYDSDLRKILDEGKSWSEYLVPMMVERIETKKVHLTFDIDVFDPSLCPSTGTPVPGGLSMWQAKTLINEIARKKEIVSFDLNEVVPKTRVDMLTGAEIWYHLYVETMRSNGLYEGVK